ncbi:MAG: AMP-binding protein [Caenibius sp.]
MIEVASQAELTEFSVSSWPATRDWPLLDMTLGDLLRHAADTVPDRTALVEVLDTGDTGRRWTYAELLSWSEATARALLGKFKPGERVAVCANNVAEWVPLLYGSAMAGLVLVTVNPACRPRELRFILEKSRAAGLFIIPRFRGTDCLATARDLQDELPELREIVALNEFDAFLADQPADCAMPPVAPLDPCLTLFTSGTTGQPKGAVLHHKGVLNMARMTHSRGGLEDGGVFVSPMPLFYIGGLGHVGIGAVAFRATHVIVPQWEPELFMRTVEREGGSYSLLVPTMIEALLAHPSREQYDLKSLTSLISGASLVEAQLIRRVHTELGATLVNVYGQTEMHGVCITTLRDDPLDKVTSTIGRPIPHFDIKIANPETGEPLAVGEEGEIWVRSFQNMLGYFGQPEETARTITSDGWLRSGDLARMDAQGYVTITGRIKEMIIRGGENIYPREVEEVLLGHPDVDAVAVVGVPDPFYGEKVVAVVIPKANSSLSAEDLNAFARENLMHFKVPSGWGFAAEFPFTDTGKLQKFKLRDGIVSGEIPIVETSAPRKVKT